MANDIYGLRRHEPAAYVTEVFVGDGVTAQFNLGAEPFFNPAAKTTLITEIFDGPLINGALWIAPAGSNYFNLGAGGLTMSGGGGLMARRR